MFSGVSCCTGFLALAGINLLWNPVIEQFPEDPESPGKPKVRLSTSPSELVLIRRDVLAQLAAARERRWASFISCVSRSAQAAG